VRGHQTHLTSWRPDACNILQGLNFGGNVIIPEFTNLKESDKYRYDVPVWENAGLTRSDAILFWVARTKELIALTTNYELGYWTARDRDKIVYGRPDTAYRVTYDDIMWVEDAKRYKPMKDCTIYNTLEKTTGAAMDLAHERWLQKNPPK
jgi:nucleoside 2-deoxyribosyltransferase